MITAINPATEETIAKYTEHSDAEIGEALNGAAKAFRLWRTTGYRERADLLRAISTTLKAQTGELAALITAEMGKPIVESEAEIAKCAWNCDHYAESGERYLTPIAVKTEATESYVEFAPLGTVLAIMPWNFPFWQLFRFLAPALMAGNAAILKHASNVPGCSLAIERVVREAGAPAGLFRAVLMPGSRVKTLIEDKRIAAVTLTGSSEVGATVASQSGGVLKKQVLELGGSDPFIVLADANIAAAATAAARARNQNSGQSCIASKRFIVEESVADNFVELFRTAVANLKLGDPAARETQLGPLARADLRDTLESQVERSVKAGARLALGGKTVDGRGYFFQATILDNVTADMAAFREETFGPAAAVVRARNEQEAIDLANDSDFGLGASLWTNDLERARRIAPCIESGNVFVNQIVASDPRLPFGGVKLSGYGRELGEFGIREFTNTQTVSMKAL